MVDVQKNEQRTFLSTSSDDPLVGAVVGDKFRIVSRVSGGGLFDMYRATDTNEGRTVAIKILRVTQNVTSHPFTAFSSNARSTFRHPNFVATIASGLTGDGEPWLALEWLEGKSLQEFIAGEGAMSIANVLPVFEQIGDALTCAHAEGEVHMNLQPSNILLVERDGKQLVKIYDLGYSKMLMERELEMADEKAPARGSTLYMSPEQFKGTLLDARSDIYSVGCMLYESLYGRPPHQGADLLETMDRHMHGELTFPSEPELSEQVQAVLAKMLAKQSTERQRSMADALADIKNALRGEFPKEEVRPQPTVAFDARGVDFITAKRGSAAKKGREPWMLLMGCLTVLLFVVIFQQCMIMVQDLHAHQHKHAKRVDRPIIE